MAMDTALKLLTAQRLAQERELQALESVAADISAYIASPAPDTAALQERLRLQHKVRDELQVSIGKESERLTQLRRLQVELKEKNAQLRALAALALQHLDDRCPVCEQEFDKEKTRTRLKALAQGTEPTAGEPDAQQLTKLLAGLSDTERQITATQLEIKSAEQLLHQRRATENSIGARLRELGFPVPEGAKFGTVGLAERIGRTRQLLEQLSNAQQGGEALALELAHSSAAASVEEMRRERDSLRQRYDAESKELAARTATGEEAQRVIEALRQASLDVVGERLDEINSLLQSIYARIDPHPAFRLVRFLSSVVRGRGQLSTLVSDPITEKQSDNPAAVLSSSQLNALAVAIFFALNIGAPLGALPIAMLDDPMQSMDDINLLGLVDLLRRLKGQRQILVSTHDSRFGELLSRKLRPTGQEGRTIVIDLQGWSRQGPTVRHHDVAADIAKLRLVASG